ncbi:MAG: M67 family metallopeptidase [bacterium]
MIRISPEHLEAIQKHGESDYPYECCGMLFGTFDENKQKIVHEIFPISNAWEETTKRNRFLITVDEFMQGELAARKKKLDIIGFYHSHPDHPAVPSQFDLEHAWPLYSYIIIAVQSKQGKEITSWELNADRSQFTPETIEKELTNV